MYTLVDKGIKLTHESFHKNNLDFIKKCLHLNNYPISFIELYIRKRLKFLNLNKDYNPNIILKSKYNNCLILPFVKQINPIFKKCLLEYNISIVNTMSNKFDSIIKLGKDFVKKLDNSNVVYKIHCCDCLASYVGQTSRKLSNRLYEHKYDCKNKKPSSALYDHIEDTGHNINFDKIIILDHEPNLNKRLLSEMVHIHAQNSSLNRQYDTQKLKNEYKSFIKETSIF